MFRSHGFNFGRYVEKRSPLLSCGQAFHSVHFAGTPQWESDVSVPLARRDQILGRKYRHAGPVREKDHLARY